MPMALNDLYPMPHPSEGCKETGHATDGNDLARTQIVLVEHDSHPKTKAAVFHLLKTCSSSQQVSFQGEFLKR